MAVQPITSLCQECGKQFAYELKPGFPRKYCFECGEIKKQSFAGKAQAPEQKPLPEIVAAPHTNDVETSVMTSYAKDIFIAMAEDTKLGAMSSEDKMAMAIDLVKQARKEFS